ncbi:hypothetical protein GOP47_0021682 [Adiantum capillus-veneris]|uniref:Uncharacterized protein n=1 Tax=Adiantum capillus-veneris TaxID=13818 RepID=A0A9D4U8K8_ADICA|nr:hypothetical protein GOP47_0021682 [Adiantum capillus-veneris]
MMQVVEVQGPDGKAYRFAAGTTAGFAVDRINARLHNPSAQVLFLEATHPGGEPVEFGPNAELTILEDGWTLRGVSHQIAGGLRSETLVAENLDPGLFYPGGKLPRGRNAEFTFEYMGKVFLCFLFMLVLGFMLKSFLEQLPMLLKSEKHVHTDNHEL